MHMMSIKSEAVAAVPAPVGLSVGTMLKVVVVGMTLIVVKKLVATTPEFVVQYGADAQPVIVIVFVAPAPAIDTYADPVCETIAGAAPSVTRTASNFKAFAASLVIDPTKIGAGSEAASLSWHEIPAAISVNVPALSLVSKLTAEADRAVIALCGANVSATQQLGVLANLPVLNVQV